MSAMPLDEMGKDNSRVQPRQADDDFANDKFAQEDAFGAASDRQDMLRLGKRQELKRRFRFFSIVGYVVVLGLTWEYTLVTSAFSLANGGTAGAIWLSLVTICGMCMTMLSFAEMASMAPTSGGQYHWVSEFAPPNLQKPLSYAVGWMAAIGWQVTMPGVSYVAAQQVLALISLCQPDYVIQGWQGTLLTIAFTAAAIFFNTSVMGKINILEMFAAALHFSGFCAFLAVIWAFGPRASAATTFTTFANDNGWSSVGVATLVGMVGPAVTFLGSDSAVHLAEELENASYTLPRAMCSAAVINYTLGWIMMITLMCNLGDLTTDLASPTGQPYVAVIQRITNSKGASIVLTVVMTILYFFCAVNQVTTSSRQIFAFARDKGLPFHRFLSKVRPNGVPANSVYVTLVITVLLSLIIIGSTAAFNIILSVGATGLFTSYMIVIATMLAKRLRRGQRFPPCKFSLGAFGVPINIGALCFLVVAFVFMFFPAAPAPSAAGMNWAVLIYGVALCFAMGYYFVRGRHEYEGPVTYVRREY